MKFELYLDLHGIEGLTHYYINYEKLKGELENETAFVIMLDSELARVFEFVNGRIAEMKIITKELEKEMKNSADKSLCHTQIADIKEDLRKLTEFTRVNIVGFNKIIKRHDNKSKIQLKKKYKKILKRKVESLESIDSLLYRVSKIYLSSTEFNLSNKLSNVKFVRNTAKYWVHRENLMALKCVILKHLPIYVFSNNTDPSASPYHNWDSKLHDTCVSSVYLDNENFDLYKGRLRKFHGAEAIRIRWYTNKMPENVFMERKRHEEDWTGEESKKLRFKIPERCVTDYLKGKNVWKEVQKVNCGDLISDTYELYTEIQAAIINKNLRPVTRTFYKRTAFQRPDSANIRISLDSNLCMIKECSDFKSPLLNWRREDVNCEYPFYNVKDSEIVRFPYSILEVKLQSLDHSVPDWIEDLTKGTLIEHVHKFSKYIHGSCILYPQIREIPYWLPQMDTDIRRHSPNNKVRDFKDGVLIEIPDKNNGNSDSSRAEIIIDDNKRIAIPVRVEPKVFFANERTFLSWLHFSIFIGGIGTAMMGLGDHRAVWSGIVFIAVSVLFAVYALYLYFWRAGMIRVRDPGPYDDLYGPVILVVVFLFAMLLSILFKFPMK